MNTGNRFSIAVITLLMLFVCPASYAADEAGMSDKLTFQCEKGTFAVSKYFTVIQQAAHRINASYCALLTSKVPANATQMAEIARDLRAFGELVQHTVVQRMDIPELANMRQQVVAFKVDLDASADNPSGLPPMQVSNRSTILEVKKTFFFGSNQDDAQKVDDNNNGACKSLAEDQPDCDVYLEDLAEAINPYQKNANAFNVYKTRVQLSGLSAEWNSYFETGRYQNSASIALTTWAEGAHFAQDRLVGPPPRQWNALQPNLVIENVSEAADGDNIEYALSIEWFGVNWWKESPLGIPFGISVASVYADRAEIKDVGHGFMFHFDNQYTLGIADHDGDQGVYVTLDLLKLFMDKEAQLEKYRDDFRQAVE